MFSAGKGVLRLMTFRATGGLEGTFPVPNASFVVFQKGKYMGNGTIIELTGISVPCLITGGYLHIERTGSPLCVPFNPKIGR